jgi:hypothetical protein
MSALRNLVLAGVFFAARVNADDAVPLAWVRVNYAELPRKRNVPSFPFGRNGSHCAIDERISRTDCCLFSVSHQHRPL